MNIDTGREALLLYRSKLCKLTRARGYGGSKGDMLFTVFWRNRFIHQLAITRDKKEAAISN